MKYKKLISKCKSKTIIIDFDHTITLEKSITSNFAIKESLCLSKYQEFWFKFKRHKNKLLNYIIWVNKQRILTKYMTPEILDKTTDLLYVNEEIKELLNYAHDNGYKIIILSAGRKEVIEKFLNKEKISYDKVIANDTKVIVTPVNKSKFVLDVSKPILIGDENDDAYMHPDPFTKIGICHDITKCEDMNKHFDHVKLYNYEILERHRTAKTNVMIVKQNNQTYFFKEKNENTISEIEGYNVVKDYYKVSKFLINSEDYLVYEYIDDFRNNTLNDYLYTRGRSADITDLLNSISKSLDETMWLIDQRDSKNYKFFNERLYLLHDLSWSMKVYYYYVAGYNENIRMIIDHAIKEISKPQQLFCFVTNGDPTDTNITANGYITDFETAGLNSVVGEIAILFVSLFSHGAYFYPKYNSKAYSINKTITKKYDKYKQDVTWWVIRKRICFEKPKIKINKKNKEILLQILGVYRNNHFYEAYSKDLKLLRYYICVRLLTPITVDRMDDNDKYTIYMLIGEIYRNVYNLDSLIKFVENMEEF